MVDPEQLADDLVDAWHNSPEDGRPLHEFMGMSWDQYKRWVECRMPAAELAEWATGRA